LLLEERCELNLELEQSESSLFLKSKESIGSDILSSYVCDDSLKLEDFFNED
jgi:hypothetical protein